MADTPKFLRSRDWALAQAMAFFRKVSVVEALRKARLFKNPNSQLAADEARRVCERLSRFLPATIKKKAFEPHYLDLLNRFNQDVLACRTRPECERLAGRLVADVRQAVLCTYAVWIKELAARSLRWLGSALLGDAAVRAVYWFFSR